MTKRDVFNKIRAMGLSCAYFEGEWRIAYKGDMDSAYFTPNAEDAIATAKQMVLNKRGLEEF